MPDELGPTELPEDVGAAPPAPEPAVHPLDEPDLEATKEIEEMTKKQPKQPATPPTPPPTPPGPPVITLKEGSPWLWWIAFGLVTTAAVVALVHAFRRRSGNASPDRPST